MTDDERHASDSLTQRAAEAEVLRKASAHFHRELKPTDVLTPAGLTVKVDGADQERSILVEVYVRQTKLKSGNKRKIMVDALRLAWFRDFLTPTPHVALCLTSHAAAQPLQWDEARSKWPGWAAEALHDLGVEVCVFPLDDEGPARDAARRQRR